MSRWRKACPALRGKTSSPQEAHQSLIRFMQHEWMAPGTLTLLAIAALYNVVVFCVYWLDKNAARNGERRVREDTLLALALFGGGVGALLAQRLLRHKTRKQPFPVALPTFFVVQITAVSAVLIAPESAAAALDAVLRSFAGN